MMFIYTLHDVIGLGLLAIFGSMAVAGISYIIICDLVSGFRKKLAKLRGKCGTNGSALKS